MSCRLCGQTRPLRRSHIVSEFLYKSFYDSQHRFYGMSAESSRPIKLFQKGLRERLLCGVCEGKFSVYENYASEFFRATAAVTIETELRNLDYRLLKLFFLSLAWRFGVTSLEFFAGLQLGLHEPIMRAMLLAEDPGTIDNYPFSLVAVLADGSRLRDFMVPPSSPDLRNNRIWNIVVAGHVLTYFIDAPEFQGMWRLVTLQPQGTMFFQTREMSDIPYLYDHTRRIAQAQRERGGRLPH